MKFVDWLKENKLKVVAGVVVALAVGFIAFVAISIWTRGRPDNHNEAMYGKIKVAVDSALLDPTDRWSEQNLSVIRNSLVEAQRLGPTVELVNGEADITIYKAELDCDRQGVARYFPNTKIIEIDPRCTASDLELQTVVIHELGHFMGMQHICKTNRETECSPVGIGPAVMNSGVLTRTNNGPGFDEVWVGEYPTWQVTELDVLEFKRVYE